MKSTDIQTENECSMFFLTCVQDVDKVCTGDFATVSANNEEHDDTQDKSESRKARDSRNPMLMTRLRHVSDLRGDIDWEIHVDTVICL